MVSGIIFDIKKFAVHDGPGIRTTVFLKGCPMRCWWCHNPEGLYTDPDIFYYENRCMGCGDCIKVCSIDAISEGIIIDREKCTNCGECVEICPTTALRTTGRTLYHQEVIEEVRRYSVFYERSDGGVTFSGGEPFMQPGFLKALLEGCREEDIHTAIDTSGYVKKSVFESMLNLTDLYLYDIKLIDDKSHKKYTGRSNLYPLQNLKILYDNGRSEDVVVRFPVIPSITDTESNLEEVSSLLSEMDIEVINLLAYHNVEEKYIMMGEDYKGDSIPSPKDDDFKKVKEFFEKEGYIVKEGG